MSNLNVVVLVGNLTRDPELRYTQTGTARAVFSLAVNRYWNDRDGNRQEETTFVPVVVWGAQAENCANYLKKGRAAAVQGRLSIRKFTGDDGQPRKIAEVVADNVQFLGGPSGGGGRAEDDDTGYQGSSTEDYAEDEIPF